MQEQPLKDAKYPLEHSCLYSGDGRMGPLLLSLKDWSLPGCLLLFRLGTPVTSPPFMGTWKGVCTQRASLQHTLPIHHTHVVLSYRSPALSCHLPILPCCSYHPPHAPRPRVSSFQGTTAASSLQAAWGCAVPQQNEHAGQAQHAARSLLLWCTSASSHVGTVMQNIIAKSEMQTNNGLQSYLHFPYQWSALASCSISHRAFKLGWSASFPQSMVTSTLRSGH